tara:strand:- start:388 stop:738 length:351 start_codon:yes stop_codon:yes gene_type:complete
MNNNNFKNKTSGLPTGKMKQNNKNAAITQLFNERNQINNEYQLYKFKNREVIKNLHNKINEMHNQIKYLKENQDKNNKEFVNELLSFYSSDIKTCNCADEECEHRVNLLSYLNTPD